MEEKENDEIIIERYRTPTVYLYKLNGELVGTIDNEHECNKVRIQMLKKKVTDKYYFMWEDIKLTVDTEGNLSSFPLGLYDQVQRDMAEMFTIARQQKQIKNNDTV